MGRGRGAVGKVMGATHELSWVQGPELPSGLGLMLSMTWTEVGVGWE